MISEQSKGRYMKNIEFDAMDTHSLDCKVQYVTEVLTYNQPIYYAKFKSFLKFGLCPQAGVSRVIFET